MLLSQNPHRTDQPLSDTFRPSRWSGRGTAGLVVVGGLLALLILSAPGRGTAAVLSSSSHRRNSTTQQTVDGDVLDDPNCIDDHPDQCPAAADRGECQTLHASTRPVCRKSCWRCVNATELRLEGIGDDEMYVAIWEEASSKHG